MTYRVYQVEIKKKTAREQLEQFLNELKGEIISVVPHVSPVFKPMGATSKVDFLLIIEKVE